MKRILITGASGFLGSRAALYFKNKYQVFTPTHHEMDITDAASVEEVFSEICPDLVLHCAAISDVGRCDREPEVSWKINVDGCVNIAKAAEKIGAKCVQCSSDQIYFGSVLDTAHDEDEEVSPMNLYGKEKLEAEKRCLDVNPDCKMLRLSWMYDTKRMKETEHGDFMRTLLAQLESDEMLSYAVCDKRGISDVNEVIANIEKAFCLPGGVYNFGSYNDRSMYDTMYEVFDGLGLDTKRIQPNTIAFYSNPRNITMCQNKLNACGIMFSTTIENLTKTIEKVRKEP